MWKRVNSFDSNIARIQDTLEKEQPVLDLDAEVSDLQALHERRISWLNEQISIPQESFQREEFCTVGTVAGFNLKSWRKG